MLRRLIIQQRIIKRFVLMYIAGLIAVGSLAELAIALTFDPVQNLSANLTGSAKPQVVASASNIYIVATKFSNH